MKKLILIGLALFLPAPTQACTIPVFRYALEKWDLTRYDLFVYHRGRLPVDLEKTLKAWDDAPNKANLDITTIDLDGKVTPKQRKLWESEGKNADTPWMLVRYREAEPDASSAWSASCTVANLQRLADSPARQAILSYLTRGSSHVFVMLSSDDADLDRTVHAKLQKDLAALERRIKLDTPAETDLAKLRLPLPIKVSLPLLKLDRGNPEEAAFVKLLLATEDLARTKGPIVFPIFGRGRVLCSLSGDEIDDKLSFATEFLCKGCSCDVKELNPGVDMLMLANWNEIFGSMYEAKDAPLPREGEPVIAPKTPTLAPVVEPPPPTDGPPEPVCFECPIARNWRWIASGLGGVLILATASFFYLWRK